MKKYLQNFDMDNNDYIEKLLRENMEFLNDPEPAEGHFDRFEEKIRKQSRKSKFNLTIVWKVAAAAVFIFLAVNQAIIWYSSGRDTNVTLSSVSPQFKDAEFYYTSAISNGLSQWEKLTREGLVTPAETDMMNNELNEFEKIHKNLQVELSANPYDERVISAMLEYYQAKLSIINMVVDKLKEVQSLNNKNHEIKM